jgi:hypothetical protein
MRRYVLTTALALASLTAGLGAQFSEKTVIAEMKSALKKDLNDLKSSLTAPLASLDDAFAQLESDALDGTVSAPEAQAFLDAAVAFQTSVMEAQESFDTACASDLASGLDVLGPLEGRYPPGFYAGDGGLFDDAHAVAAAQVGKLYGKVSKRAAKAIKLCAKRGVGLTVQFAPPPRVAFATPGENHVDASDEVTTTLGVLVGVSSLEEAGDGMVLAAGTTDPDRAEVEVLVIGLDATLLPVAFAIDTLPDAQGAWSALLDASGAGLPEGNWHVQLDLDPGAETGAGRVGVP